MPSPQRDFQRETRLDRCLLCARRTRAGRDDMLNLRLLALAPVVLLVVLCAPAHGQPAVSAASGQWAHKSTVTITGSSFGSKPTAAPVVWDDASGTAIGDKWDGAWPDTNPAYNTTYRAPLRGIGLPHNHISKYIAGAHAEALGPQSGYAVIFFKTRTISLPAYTFATWYERVDDNWTFGGDDNFKTFAFSVGDGPYELPNNWYLEYNPRPTSRTSGATWHVNDDGTSLQTPDANGHTWWWEEAINPMSGVWKKIELEIKYTTANDGYIKLWENGALKINYRGRTDNLSGTMRTEGIGGYARNYGNPSNWRYFADAYLDYSRARVIVGNAPTLAASTIREVQIPSSWSASSITLSVNLGAFSDGQTAYVYVFDANGVANTNGLPITIGVAGPPDTTPPTVTAATPTAGTTGVPIATAVTATFSEAMDAASIGTGSFELRTPANVLVAATVGYNAGTRLATLTPSAALAGSVVYTATVKGGSAGVRDAAGNALTSNYVWSFTTATAADTTPPVVSSVSPVSGATGVSVAALAIVTFNEPMTAASISTSTIELRGPGSVLLPASVIYDSVSRTATLTPSSVLANGTAYTATVKAGATGVRDSAGNPLASAYTWSFTTAAAQSGLVASYAFNETSGVTVDDGSGNGNTGTISGATRAAAGKYGSGLDFNGTTAWVTVPDAPALDLSTAMTLEAWVYPRALAGWNTVLLKEITGGLAYAIYANANAPFPIGYMRPPGAANSIGAAGTAALALNAWSHLAATYDGATVRLYVNGAQVGSQAATGPITTSTGPLRIGGNGVWGEYFSGLIDEVRVYSRALSVAEIQSDMATPLAPGTTDTIPPAVTSALPGGSVRAGLLSKVTVIFSEPVQASTIAGSTIDLRDAANVHVTATVSYNAATRTATLTPASPLTNGVLYRATVKGGASGVKDIAGNVLAADFTWTFTATKLTTPANVRIVR
jgi:hypothetical protein